MKREVWWIVVVNYGGITGPIRCIKKGEDSCWDRSGNFDCSMKAGLWPIGGQNTVCSQYQTTSKLEADIFAEGCHAVRKLLTGILN